MSNLMFALKKEKKEIKSIPIELIVTNSEQPRKVFDIEEIENLSKSIQENGLIQPIVVRKKDKFYEIVAGERRYRALTMANFSKVDCIVNNLDDRQASIIALVENIQRKDLNFFEEAKAYVNIMKQNNIKQEELSKSIAKSQSAISNKLRLLKLSEEVQEIILKNNLTERHARALLTIDSEEKIKQTLDYIIENALNVRQTEDYIKNNFILKRKVKRIKNIFIVRDVRIFLNSINKIIKTMKSSGIVTNVETHEDGEYINYTIKIRNKAINKKRAV